MGIRSYAERTWFDSQEQMEEALLAAVPTTTGRMLDVGCDDGSWTERVRECAGVAPEAVSGIEIVDDRRALAEARGYTVRPGDLEERWPFDDEEFALVHANQVIEHVKRLDHFALEAKRVLKPGGHAVICTENLASWHNIAALIPGFQPFSVTNISNTGALGNPLSMHQKCAALDHGESWQHIHVITMVALVELFEAHGFDVVHRFGGGYHPLRGKLARCMVRRDLRHAHFIGLVARKPR